jgi:hypothetical protein
MTFLRVSCSPPNLHAILSIRVELDTNMNHDWLLSGSYTDMDGRPTVEYRCTICREWCTLKDEELLTVEGECDGKVDNTGL